MAANTFKFNFVEDKDAAGDESSTPTAQGYGEHRPVDGFEAPFRELSLDELVSGTLFRISAISNLLSAQISSLPPALSFSPVHFQFPVPKHPDIIAEDSDSLKIPEEELERIWHRTQLTLVRRDLFDARFQLIAQGRDAAHDAPTRSESPTGNKPRELDFLDNPSDLSPGVYEGGLKTWESSLDLVEYLECAVARACGGPEWVRCTRVLEVSQQILPMIHPLSMANCYCHS